MTSTNFNRRSTLQTKQIVPSRYIPIRSLIRLVTNEPSPLKRHIPNQHRILIQRLIPLNRRPNLATPPLSACLKPKHNTHTQRKLTKKAQDPTNVANVNAYSTGPPSSTANPNAPQSVNPIAPTRFQNPTCHPNSDGAGMYHLSCTSTMNNKLDTTNPVPPTTCGSQYAPFCSARAPSAALICGIAVNPEIQKTVAPRNWERQARKPISRR